MCFGLGSWFTQVSQDFWDGSFDHVREHILSLERFSRILRPYGDLEC